MMDVRRKTLTDQEVARLLEVTKRVAGPGWRARPRGRSAYRDYVLMALLANTGLRTSEALALTREDLDTASARIRVQTLKHGRPDMTWVKIPRALVRPLRDVWSSGPQPERKGLIFAISARRARAVFQRWARVCRIRPGIGLHGFRHALAVRMIRAGRSTAEVQKVLRHASLSSTQVYLDAVTADDALDGVRPIL